MRNTSLNHSQSFPRHEKLRMENSMIGKINGHLNIYNSSSVWKHFLPLGIWVKISLKGNVLQTFKNSSLTSTRHFHCYSLLVHPPSHVWLLVSLGTLENLGLSLAQGGILTFCICLLLFSSLDPSLTFVPFNPGPWPLPAQENKPVTGAWRILSPSQ